tara:strand:- start:1296 stop:1703 length:408 start_codon:yes stop_codon:yes gene_type:complete
MNDNINENAIKNEGILQERYEDLESMIVRVRVLIEGKNDPTILDIMTDMRALPGIVTARQNRPVSDTVTTNKKRILELKVSYIPKMVHEKGLPNLETAVITAKLLKNVEGCDMIKLVEHTNDILNYEFEKNSHVY